MSIDENGIKARVDNLEGDVSVLFDKVDRVQALGERLGRSELGIQHINQEIGRLRKQANTDRSAAKEDISTMSTAIQEFKADFHADQRERIEKREARLETEDARRQLEFSEYKKMIRENIRWAVYISLFAAGTLTAVLTAITSYMRG